MDRLVTILSSQGANFLFRSKLLIDLAIVVPAVAILVYAFVYRRAFTRDLKQFLRSGPCKLVAVGAGLYFVAQLSGRLVEEFIECLGSMFALVAGAERASHVWRGELDPPAVPASPAEAREDMP